MSRLRTNRVCFTVNNYESDDIDYIESLVENASEGNGVKYLVVGIEEGESGTPHLQGFIHIDHDRKKCGINFWRDYFPFGKRAHFEAARGSDEQSREYCSKDGIYIEYGEPCSPKDHHEKIFETAKTDVQAAVAIDYEFGMKYYSNLKAIYADHQKAEFNLNITLHGWQEKAIRLLENQNDRQILFVVDIVGGKGKSTLTKFLLTSRNAWACQGGKTHDLMHAHSKQPNVDYVIFDMARCNNTDWYPWNFMENLKNGWYTTTKYNGYMATFKPPKLVVFMNEEPPRDKFSADRYCVFRI